MTSAGGHRPLDTIGTRGGAGARHGVRATRAVAIAIRPSSRPGNPRPSVVAPETDTGAPTASERIFCASSRRLPIFGRGPTTWTATLPMVKPAARTIRAASVSATPDAPDHSGRPVPKWAPRSPIPAAENSALQAACATTSASECPASPGPALPEQPGAPQLPPLFEGVDVGTDADLRQRHGHRRG